MFQDLSERMRREEEIRANERLLDGIFELLPVGLRIADKTGRMVRANPAGLRIWGGARYVAPSEYGVYKAWWVNTGEPVAPEDWALYRVMTRGEASLGELLRIQCFDGTFKTIINSALPLFDEQGGFAGAIVVNEDITELRAIEEALQRAVVERDQVLAVVSHDLRNPLSSIGLAAQLIARHAPAPEGSGLSVAIDAIVRATRMMSRLIEDLCDLASLREGHLSIRTLPLAPGAVVDEVVLLHAEAAKAAGVALVADVAAGARPRLRRPRSSPAGADEPRGQRDSSSPPPAGGSP